MDLTGWTYCGDYGYNAEIYAKDDDIVMVDKETKEPIVFAKKKPRRAPATAISRLSFRRGDKMVNCLPTQMAGMHQAVEERPACPSQSTPRLFSHPRHGECLFPSPLFPYL